MLPLMTTLQSSRKNVPLYAAALAIASAGAGSHYCTICTFRSRSHSSSEARGVNYRIAATKCHIEIPETDVGELSSSNALFIPRPDRFSRFGEVEDSWNHWVMQLRERRISNETARVAFKHLYNGIWRGDIARQDGLDRYGCRVMAI